MSEEYLVWQTAPTLAGLKTGSLFPCKYESYETLKREICEMNKALSRKGLRLIPLRREGYADLRQERCLHELMRRLQRFEAFPHEIGLFLSYPPEDVRGFIEHKGHESKCEGCWKVYGDAERAKKTFRTYKKCTDCYCRQQAKGVPIARLAVAG